MPRAIGSGEWPTMGNNNRQVRVRAACAALYPEVPAGRWATAGGIALRVAARIWRDRGLNAVVSHRLLPEEHFEFRGGLSREPTWEGSPERLSDGGEPGYAEQSPSPPVGHYSR